MRSDELKIARFENYTKVKIYGGPQTVYRQPKNDSLVHEPQEAIKTLSVDRRVSIDEITLFGSLEVQNIVPTSQIVSLKIWTYVRSFSLPLRDYATPN